MWRKSILWPISIAIFLLDIVNSTPSVLLSSPFDNFRIECPHYSGAQRLRYVISLHITDWGNLIICVITNGFQITFLLNRILLGKLLHGNVTKIIPLLFSIRMIESQGMVRQDTVFALSCNHISEVRLYIDEEPLWLYQQQRFIILILSHFHTELFYSFILGGACHVKYRMRSEKIVAIVDYSILSSKRNLMLPAGRGNIWQVSHAFQIPGKPKLCVLLSDRSNIIENPKINSLKCFFNIE